MNNTNQDSSSSKAHKNIVVYVGDLAPSTTEHRLLQVFSNESRPLSVRVFRSNIGVSYMYAHVAFATQEAADAAIECYNFTNVDGNTIRMMHQTDFGQINNKHANVYIKNIPAGYDARVLYEMLRYFGRVLSIKIPEVVDKRNPSNRLRLNYGFVQFPDPEMAQNAIEGINKLKLQEGSSMEAQVFVPREERKPAKGTDDHNLILLNVPVIVDKSDLARNLKVRLIGPGTEADADEIPVELFDLSPPLVGRVLTVCFIRLANQDDYERLEKNVEKMAEATPSETRTLRLERVIDKVDLVNLRREEHRARLLATKGRNIIVRCLPKTFTESEFRQLCGKYGEIESIHMPMLGNESYNTPVNRGYGFCCYVEKEDAEKAVEILEGYFVNMRSLSADFVKSKKDRMTELVARMQLNLGLTAVQMPGAPIYMDNRRPQRSHRPSPAPATVQSGGRVEQEQQTRQSNEDFLLKLSTKVSELTGIVGGELEMIVSMMQKVKNNAELSKLMKDDAVLRKMVEAIKEVDGEDRA